MTVQDDGTPQPPLAAALALDHEGRVVLLASGMNRPVGLPCMEGDVPTRTPDAVAKAIKLALADIPTMVIVVGTTSTNRAGWDKFDAVQFTSALDGPAVTQCTEADALAATVKCGPDTAYVVYRGKTEVWYLPTADGAFTVAAAPAQAYDVLQKEDGVESAQFVAHINTSARRLSANHSTIRHMIVWSATRLHEVVASLEWGFLYSISPNSALTGVTILPDITAPLRGALLAATHVLPRRNLICYNYSMPR